MKDENLHCYDFHLKYEQPCEDPEVHNRPDCRYHIRNIPEVKMTKGLESAQVNLRCAMICAKFGPLTHEDIAIIEDISRPYVIMIEKKAKEKLRKRLLENGY